MDSLELVFKETGRELDFENNHEELHLWWEGMSPEEQKRIIKYVKVLVDNDDSFDITYFKESAPYLAAIFYPM